MPGAVVWRIINDRLWRCAPQQLRRASERELVEHTLLQQKPWTFENITRDLVVGQFRDVTEEEYPEEVPEEEMGEAEGQEPVFEEDTEEMEHEPTPARTVKREHPTGRQRFQRRQEELST